jgi:hypothetical protein
MTTEVETFRVGDRVILADDVPGRPQLKAGKRGVVVVGNDLDYGGIWQMVSVVLGEDPDRGPAWLLHPRHLRKVRP